MMKEGEVAGGRGRGGEGYKRAERAEKSVAPRKEWQV
jgi:hypothetical protein